MSRTIVVVTAFAFALSGSATVIAQQKTHSHASADHVHSKDDQQIYKGYFEDSQIKDRPLSDYAGDWQSVYPYLQDGTLEAVWEHKSKTAT
ncbi:pXO1-130 like-protein; C-terminal of zinc-binding protein AdcA [Fulvimarina pelagi HTCC2506]|uniref:PXO1-130 like-protein C-terminal of zinc-binding protein AdcA n=2 Tax=Fulvimarina pelagi TaxID=217511 RepID=Q0G2X7_9HYPH|nr:pXO1-130 like-protein; C-terminal of zinc-binding protein AdcA [Fulvimarina pelagi HTCC2506]BAT31023.1 pXO1-130 like-protein; C-terminal of zinc-binding protein AdcA [Fulvimarina pelagi]